MVLSSILVGGARFKPVALLNITLAAAAHPTLPSFVPGIFLVEKFRLAFAAATIFPYGGLTSTVELGFGGGVGTSNGAGSSAGLYSAGLPVSPTGLYFSSFPVDGLNIVLAGTGAGLSLTAFSKSPF